MKQALRTYLVSQFGRPRGPLGVLAGWIMARRDSNQRRNLWTIDLMELQPTHHVLEVGYGPGFALQHLCGRLPEGRAVGLDHSRTMYRMARARNRAAVEQGRLVLKVGSVGDLESMADAELTGPFDRIYAANVAMFWRDPINVLRLLESRLAPGGGIFLTFQPRLGEKSDRQAMAFAEKTAGHMREAGLEDVRIETLKDLAPMAVCIIGTKTEAGGTP